MKSLHFFTFTLIIIGALNWLLLAIFHWEIGQLFGGMYALTSRIIYILIGMSAIIELFEHKRNYSGYKEDKNKEKPEMISTNMPE